MTAKIADCKVLCCEWFQVFIL